MVGSGQAPRAGLDAADLGGVEAVHSDELTIATVPERGDPWATIDDEPQSLEPLLELHERDRASGLMDAPWPPVHPKQPDEPPRVAPSRAAARSRARFRT